MRTTRDEGIGRRRAGWCGCFVACGIGLFSSASVAVPADASLVVAPGTERILRTNVSITGVAWEPPDALVVEPLPSDFELLVQVSAKAKGEVVLLVAGNEAVNVFRICVGDPAKDCPKATSIEDAKPKCPGLAKGDDDGKPVWMAGISDDACLGALTAALRHAPTRPSELRLRLDEKGVFAYAARLKKALDADPSTKGLELSLLGPLIRLGGAAPREVVARALLLLWAQVPGHLIYDDGTKLLPSAPGAPKLYSPFLRTDDARTELPRTP